MKVLAIDPGYGRCGVAVIEKEGGNRETLLYSNCIETPASEDFSVRLNTVAAECSRLLDEHSPDCVALEKLYFSNNQKTAMRVAEVRGAIIAIAGAKGAPIFEYTPGQIKSAAAGSGSADKKAVAMMIRALVIMDDRTRLDDEYDAIAIGITHLAHAGSLARVYR